MTNVLCIFRPCDLTLAALLWLTLWDILSLSHLPFSASLTSLPGFCSCTYGHFSLSLTNLPHLDISSDQAAPSLPSSGLHSHIQLKAIAIRSLVVSPKLCPVSRVPHPPVLPPRTWFWRWVWVGVERLVILFYFQSICPVYQHINTLFRTLSKPIHF